MLTTKGKTLRDLAHIHPQLGPDGTWRIRTTLGPAGTYVLYDEFVHNGRTVLDLPPVPSGRERVLQIIGDDSAPHLEPLEAAIDATRAFGFVTRGLRFGSRRNQYFFVNGRLVKDRVLTHAANRAADSFDFDVLMMLAMNTRIDRAMVKEPMVAAAFQKSQPMPLGYW